MRHWTDQILDQSLRIETFELHGNKGAVFIRRTEAEMNQPDSSKNAAASARAAEMQNHRAAGIAASDTKSWTDFINADQDFNARLTSRHAKVRGRGATRRRVRRSPHGAFQRDSHSHHGREESSPHRGAPQRPSSTALKLPSTRQNDTREVSWRLESHDTTADVTTHPRPSPRHSGCRDDYLPSCEALRQAPRSLVTMGGG